MLIGCVEILQGMLLRLLLLFVVNSGLTKSALYRRQTKSPVKTDEVNSSTLVNIIISFKSNDRLKEQQLYGTFSSSGTGYEIVGDVVQMSHKLFLCIERAQEPVC
ncbi:unnamed protein product [Enterobius vermicularis]|uniref:Secreted protein n=1 Tax=Enterobius vermicularis TaxID=51028 RepID=A0A0N4VFU8_ENTVE|nr:unnamed protein product [Enterobius vermicularis]